HRGRAGGGRRGVAARRRAAHQATPGHHLPLPRRVVARPGRTARRRHRGGRPTRRQRRPEGPAGEGDPMNDNELLHRLHHRFTVDAAAAGLLDIAYRVIDSPLGPLLLAATEAGVVRVAFALEDHDAVLADLADRVSPRVLEAPARL